MVRNITEESMEKAVSAADVNRRLSKLLREVREGRSCVVTSHGKPVAKIVPVERNGGVARGTRTALLKRLRSARVVTIGRWSRDELYGDSGAEHEHSGARGRREWRRDKTDRAAPGAEAAGRCDASRANVASPVRGPRVEWMAGTDPCLQKPGH